MPQRTATIESLPMAFALVKEIQADGLEWGKGYRPLARPALAEIIQGRMAEAVIGSTTWTTWPCVSGKIRAHSLFRGSCARRWHSRTGGWPLPDYARFAPTSARSSYRAANRARARTAEPFKAHAVRVHRDALRTPHNPAAIPPKSPNYLRRGPLHTFRPGLVSPHPALARSALEDGEREPQRRGITPEAAAGIRATFAPRPERRPPPRRT